MRESLAAFCQRTGQEYLLEQWEEAANRPLSPQTVSSGSRKRIWWVCGKGHRWQAVVHTRTGSGTDCPYCTGKRPWPGETDLASAYPELVRQWHPTKNEALQPTDLLPGSHRKVWWRCDKGHQWQAAVKSRTAGSGCPYCANRLMDESNNFASRYPELAKQWHPTKNGALQPQQLPPGTKRKVWWLCRQGHEWQAEVAARIFSGSGCPYCGGKLVLPGENDFATLYPELAKQWHPTRNAPLQPTQCSAYSNRKVWWLCRRGHAYSAAISNRTSNHSACPYCSNRKVLPGFNDLATVEPQVADQWHPSLNGALTPQMVTVGSRKKVWWQCKAGHVWKAVIYSRATGQKYGCPVCAGMVRRKAPAFFE